MMPVNAESDLTREGWRPLAVDTHRDHRLEGFWRVADGSVWTVVANRPIRLR
jgi:hypothetical protein